MEISQKRDSKHAVASDNERNPLQVGDTVEILTGEHYVTNLNLEFSRIF